MDIPARYNVAAALLDRRLGAGDGPRAAIEIGAATRTYEQIAGLASRAGHALRALGVVREQRVVIVLPDSAEFVAAFLGAIAIGAVAVPCSTFLGAAEYGYFLRESRAPVLVTTAELLERMNAAAAHDLKAIVLTNCVEETANVRAWSTLVDAAPAAPARADTHKDEAAFWLWTSGSTGEPKAAVHLHQDPPWCGELYGCGVLGVTASDRMFSAAKLFHAYGLGNGLFLPFWVGATSILSPDRASAEAAYSVIALKRPTIFFGVPTLYAAMLDLADRSPGTDTSSLRFAVSAGEPLPPDLFLRWRARFGTDILDGLGSTELLHMYVASRPGHARPGSSGQPVPGYDVMVVNERGEAAGPNEIGDLLVRGPSAAVMYWNRRDQTRQRMRGEWFATGDKYLVDTEGYYRYAGRGDDMFKVSGEWISPIEIENAIAAHEAVLECAVVSYQESSGVLKPKAYVVLKHGWSTSDALAAELQMFVRKRAAGYKCPRVIEFLTELPKTATGKIQRFKLRT
jgi:benzoate-CoA ligase family protein